MEIQCTIDFFKFNGSYYDRCFIQDQNIPENTRLRFIAEEYIRTRQIDYIQFKNCIMTRVPKGLARIFPNLRILDIENCALEEICQDDLAEYKNIENLHLKFNMIEYLPGNLFEGFVNLSRIDFWDNNINIIEPNILDDLPYLEYVNFGKPDFFYQFSTIGRSIGTLEEFKQLLLENYQKREEGSENESSDDEDDNEENEQDEKIEELSAALVEARKTEVKLREEIKRMKTLDGLTKIELYMKNLELNKKNEELKQKDEELKQKNDQLIKKDQEIFSKFVELKKQQSKLECAENKMKKLNEIIKEQHEDQYRTKQIYADFKNQILEKENQKLKADLEEEKIKTSKYAEKLEKGILRDVKDFIQNEEAKDFNLIINHSEFPVHKFILQARSPTLAEILRNNPEAQNIKLTDIDEDIIEKILHFFYTDETPQEGTTDYLKLFAASGILKIQDLKNFAGEKLCKLITKENVTKVLTLSERYEHEVLKTCAFEEIKKFYPEIKFEYNWINDVSKILQEISSVKA